MKRIIALLLSFTLMLTVTFNTSITAFSVNSLTYTASFNPDVITTSETDQSVTVVISSASAFSASSIGANVMLPEGWILTELKNATVASTAGNRNLETGNLTWADTEANNHENVTEVLTATFTIPGGTPSGNYDIQVTGIAIAKDFSFTQVEENGSCIATLTITDAPAGGDGTEIPTDKAYTADLDATSSAVKVGDEVTVNILVGGTTGAFASSELNLTYSGLTYDSQKSTVNGADVTATDGAIKIIDHGDTTTWTEGGNATAYSLVFTVNSITGDSGTASVTLSNAALSTAANASGSNLTAATISVPMQTFTVTPADLTITLEEGLVSTGTGNTVVYGKAFEFEATNKNYTYTLTAVVTDTQTPVTITDVSDGRWKIENVTSNVTVSITKQEAKTYTITFTDPTHIQNQESATVSFVYDTEGGFSFTLKDNVAAGLGAGTTYTVISITYADGTAVTHTVPDTSVTTNRTYTIATEAITGDITITTSATTVEPNQFTVTLPTSTYPELTADKTVVDVNGSVELTLNPVAGYKYTVKYKIGDGEEVTINNWTETGVTDDDSLTYTISGVNANVTVSVTKEVDTSKFTVTVVNEYVAMNGKSVHLVRVSAVLDQNYDCTYDGAKMYWSTGYATAGEYVYLVITDAGVTLSVEDAKAKIGLTTEGKAGTITYDGNVNLADNTTVDANDAQLVWNMYSAKTYSDFTTVTMEKFLRADVHTDGKITVDDASDIVAIIRNPA